MNFYDAFADELEKIGRLNSNVSLRPHQRQAVDYAESFGGRALVAHGTGTGKTLTAIATFEEAKDRGEARKALVITPASLKHNFVVKGVQQFTNSTIGELGSKADYEVVSFDKFRRDPQIVLKQVRPDTIIVDEIHRAKDPRTKTHRSLMEASEYPGVDRFLGLTGSFISNHPRDIVPLLDIIHPGHELGSPQAFSKMHTRVEHESGGFLKPSRRKVVLKKQPVLGRKIEGKLHYIEHADVKGDMPRMNVEEVHVPMTREQHNLYEFALGRLSSRARAKIRAGLPVPQKEATHIFGIIQKARQASNSVGTHKEMDLAQAAERTPKIKRVMDDVQKHLGEKRDNQAVLFTHLVHGGADALQAGLEARGIKAGIYAGAGGKMGVTKESRIRDYNDFMKRKKRAIILTPAGGEGVSLDNATFFGEVDRHYNPEKNDQAIARAVRMGGLSHRKPEDRVVDVKRYHSDPRTAWYWKLLGRKEVGIDEWIGNVANEKARLNREMRDVARERMRRE
jgi:SNF2 family DNA or RNA helicase